MQCELGNFLDAVALFKQSAGCFMAQVMEVEVLNAKDMASPSERSSD
jgi:hypothetical protein